MCPIAHVPYPQGASPLCAILTTPLPMCPITHVPHYPCAPLAMCPIIHVSKRRQVVKKTSNCQKDVKLSKRCQMSNNQTHRLWRRFTKKINWHNEVHTHWHQFLMSHMMVTKNPQNGHRKCFWGFLVTIICDVKIDVNVCEPHYVNLFFFVNLLHSLCVWFFDIWHLFDNLTSFWQFDIFLTFWFLF